MTSRVLSPALLASPFSAVLLLDWPRNRTIADASDNGQRRPQQPPSREACMKTLKKGEEFDLLIIGGGATGAGAALDASARGLKVACIEREDFSSGTSSRSTKLIWAGSRYLVNAVINLLNPDLRLLMSPYETIQKFRSEIRMVMNCHRERKFLLEKQPHLTNWVPIAVPISKWILWPPPFNFYPAAMGPVGLFPLFFKMYDAMGGWCSPPSHIMWPSRAYRKYPQLADSIKYCSIFYEGQHDDARTNLAIALTAAQYGAAIANHCNALEFIYESKESKKVIGVVARDEVSGEKFHIMAKNIALCGGPFTDALRKLEDQECESAVTGASGIHIVLPQYYAPDGMGLVDMSTSDGRFLFLLPWQGHVLVGTTDTKTNDMTMKPVPAEEQIQWLLKECGKYLHSELKVRREDVLSAWSGIRPLAVDPYAKSTAAVSRDHVISHNPQTGVTFISGGKWTTYREMAEDLVDKILTVGKFDESVKQNLSKCKTLEIDLNGKEGFSNNLTLRLCQEFGVSRAVSRHLAGSFGGHAVEVCRIAEDGKTSKNISDRSLGDKIVEGQPYIRAEVVYSIRYEYARKAEDILARRMRLAFLNKKDAIRAIPVVVELMGDELHWSSSRRKQEIVNCNEFLKHFGGPEPLP